MKSQPENELSQFSIGCFVLFAILFIVVGGHAIDPVKIAPGLTEKESNDMLIATLVIWSLCAGIGSIAVIVQTIRNSVAFNPVILLLALVALTFVCTVGSAYGAKNNPDTEVRDKYKELIQASMGLAISYVLIVFIYTVLISRKMV